MSKFFPKSRMIAKVAPLALLAAFLQPLPAHSEIRSGSVEISPFVGYNFFEKRQNLVNSPVLGARIGFNITRYFGIEGTGEYMRSKVDDEDEVFSREGEFTSPIDNVDITFFHLDLLYHIVPQGNFNPYLVAGYGIANYTPRIDNRNMSEVDFGVGAKYWLARNFALRMDVRDNMIWDDKIHNVEATVGLVFAFGGRETPAPVAMNRYEPKPPPKPEPVIVRKAAAVEPPRPAPAPVMVAEAPPPAPFVIKKVVVLVAEPKAEEIIKVAVAEPKIVVLAFEDIHFDFDKSTLKPEAKTILKRNIQLLKDNPNAKVRIAGYTSASGTEGYNQSLSERRATAVQDYLISEGIVTPDRLTTIGFGENRPAEFEAAPKELYSDAAKANMRVLFEIVVK